MQNQHKAKIITLSSAIEFYQTKKDLLKEFLCITHNDQSHHVPYFLEFSSCLTSEGYSITERLSPQQVAYRRPGTVNKGQLYGKQNIVTVLHLHDETSDRNNEGELIQHFMQKYPMDDRFPTLKFDAYYVNKNHWIEPQNNPESKFQDKSVIIDINIKNEGRVGYFGVRRAVQYVNKVTLIDIHELDPFQQICMKHDLIDYAKLIASNGFEFSFESSDIYKTQSGVYYISCFTHMYSISPSCSTYLFPRMQYMTHKSYDLTSTLRDNIHFINCMLQI